MNRVQYKVVTLFYFTQGCHRIEQAYKHDSQTNFKADENKKAFEEALALVDGYLGQDYPLIIGGEHVTTEEKIVSTSPSNKEVIIGRVSKTNKDLAEKAMQEALKAFKTWSKTKPEVRADVLFKAASIIRRRKHEFSALMVREAGKPWNEADADTAEAIDFLEYYGRQMLKLKDGQPVLSRPDEYNRYDYIPLGVGVII